LKCVIFFCNADDLIRNCKNIKHGWHLLFFGNRQAASHNYIENPAVIESVSSVAFFCEGFKLFYCFNKGFIISVINDRNFLHIWIE